MLILDGFWSWFLAWLGIWLQYIIAAALVIVGGYLALALGSNPLNPTSKLLRHVGMLAIVIGLLLAWGAYKESIGAADCEARWKAANYQAQIDKLALESKIAKETAASAQAKADELAQQADEANQKASEYEKTLANSPACALTGDDLKRLRSIR